MLQATGALTLYLSKVPTDSPCWHDLGLAHMALGRMGEAIDAFRSAISANPNWTDPWKYLGQAELLGGHAQESAQAFTSALGLDGSDAAAHVGLGIALSVLGQRDRAMAEFDRALQLNPSMVAAHYNRIGLKTYSRDDADLAKLEALAARADTLSRDDRILLYFAMGKAWADAGDSTRAFTHYHVANRLKRSTLSYSVDDDIARMDEIREVMTKQTLARFSGLGNPSEMPIFIIGMPRSGSTLIEQILASHPLVTGIGEISAFRDVLGRINDGTGAVVQYPHVAQVLPPSMVARIGDLYLRLVGGRSEGRPRVADKFLGNSLYAGLIHAAFPNARIIHCGRDKVDTCLSCYTLLFGADQPFAYDMTELGRYWHAHDRLISHWREVLPSDRFLDLQYEDVVADIEPQVRRLLEFLGLHWDDQCLSFHANQRPVMTASAQQVRQPVSQSSVGRWKKHAGQIGPLLKALGVTPPV